MQSLHLLSQVTSLTTLPHHCNMSSPELKSYATVYNLQVANLEITLVECPIATPPCTPTPKPIDTPIEQPSNRPPLTLATDSEPEEGKIISHVHHHNYPLSPQSSLNVMQGHLELDAGTLRTIAIGLTNTTIGHTFQHLEAKSEIEQLCKELTDLRAEMSRQPDAECPNRFKENHGRLPDFTIPDTDSIMRQARYIRLGNGPVPFALGTLGQENDPVFQYDLFATPSYIRDTPTEPLPMWLIDAISGKLSSYHQAMDLVRSTDNWGLAAEVARYHKADARILNIAAKIHVLDCELQVIKAASRQSRSCLKGARAQHRLRALQALDTSRPTRTNTHAAGLRFSRGRPSFLDGE